MILSFDQIRAATHGALGITEEDGFYIFHRMTPRLWAAYESNTAFVKKCHATSGIRLEFYTDSDYIAFGYRISPASTREFYYFDIFVDGVMVDHLGEEKLTICKGDLKVALPEGRHKVSVYLPNLTKADLSYVELSDGASFEPFEKPLKLLCFGDSITQGYDAKYSALSYANQLADALGADVVNHAIGGDRFHANHIDEEIDYNPDVITVAYGTNDWSGAERENFVREMPEFLEKLASCYPKAKIFVVTPIWRYDSNRVTKCGFTFEEARQFIADEAGKYSNMTVIDGINLTPHVREFYSDLHLHPNDFGFMVYAKSLTAEIVKYL